MKIDPRQMERMMRQMGISSKPIEATEVIIRAKGKEIIIRNPVVTEVNMAGQKTFQIVGEPEERGEGVSQEDIKLVMEKTGKGEKEARGALEKTGGDIAQAIIDLS